MDICFIAIRTRTSTEDLYPIYKLLILCSVFDYGWLNTRDSMEKTIMDICFIAIRTRTSTEDLYPIYKLLILCSVFFCFFFSFFFFYYFAERLGATLDGRLGDLSFWYKLMGQFLSPYTIMPGLWLRARNGASGVSNQVTWEGLSAWRVMTL